MIAILAQRAQLALEDIRALHGGVAKYFAMKQEGVFADGSKFCIVTNPNQLHGREFTKYEIAEHVYSQGWSMQAFQRIREMELLAKTRVR